jgi:hypothetical protein
LSESFILTTLLLAVAEPTNRRRFMAQIKPTDRTALLIVGTALRPLSRAGAVVAAARTAVDTIAGGAAVFVVVAHGNYWYNDGINSISLNDIRSSRDLHSRTDAILEMTKNTDSVHFVRSARRKTAERTDLTHLMAKRVR